MFLIIYRLVKNLKSILDPFETILKRSILLKRPSMVYLTLQRLFSTSPLNTIDVLRFSSEKLSKYSTKFLVSLNQI